MDLKEVNSRIFDFEQLIIEKTCKKYSGDLFTGVDLGTSSIVLAVVDSEGNFVAGAMEKAKFIRDGIVVDYIGAVDVVKRLKAQLETCLKTNLSLAAGAIPPNVGEGSKKIIANILEAAEFKMAGLLDEPVAASILLGMKNGAVVDIGGGTTGVSILEDGSVVASFDEPTGGHHMNLVVAGAYRIDYDRAEEKKIRDGNEVFPIITPVAEKMALIVKKAIHPYDIETIYLVGGSTDFPQMNKLFAKELHLNIVKPYKPIYVTPMGIALGCRKEVMGI